LNFQNYSLHKLSMEYIDSALVILCYYHIIILNNALLTLII